MPAMIGIIDELEDDAMTLGGVIAPGCDKAEYFETSVASEIK